MHKFNRGEDGWSNEGMIDEASCYGCYYCEEDGRCSCPGDCNDGSGRILGMIPGTIPECNTVGKVGRILKPCRVCGAAAKIFELSGGAWVDCSNWMGTNTIERHYVCVFAQTTDDAVKRWNERNG